MRALLLSPLQQGLQLAPPPLPLGVHAGVPFEEPWLAARSDRETEHRRKHQAWVTAGVPFVAASSRASRLFEDS